MKMMNAVFKLMIAISVLLLISCEEREARNDEVPIEFGEMRKIYLALMDHEIRHGNFPDHLSDLVDKGALTTEDLQVRRLDGSFQIPEYFPNAQGGTSALLAFDAVEGTSIIINVDGSARTAER